MATMIGASYGAITAGITDLGSNLWQPTAPANPDDVRRFREAMTAGTNPTDLSAASATEAKAPTDLAPVMPPAPEPAAPPSIGETILAGMNSVRNQFDSAVENIRNILQATTEDMKVQDMLSIQMQISTLAIQQDLMGKIVGKATQNIDQMLRAQ